MRERARETWRHLEAKTMVTPLFGKLPGMPGIVAATRRAPADMLGVKEGTNPEGRFSWADSAVSKKYNCTAPLVAYTGLSLAI